MPSADKRTLHVWDNEAVPRAKWRLYLVFGNQLTTQDGLKRISINWANRHAICCTEEEFRTITFLTCQRVSKSWNPRTLSTTVEEKVCGKG